MKCSDFQNFFSMEIFCLPVGITINVVAILRFKFCKSVWIIIQTINHVKINPMSFFDMFLTQIIFARNCDTKNYDRMFDFFIRYFKISFKYLISHYFWMSAPNFIICCCCCKGLIFIMILLLKVLLWNNLKFICLSED